MFDASDKIESTTAMGSWIRVGMENWFYYSKNLWIFFGEKILVETWS